MRMPWTRSSTEQFDLVDEANADLCEGLVSNVADRSPDPRTRAAAPALELDALAAEGIPLLVPVDCLEEDPGNPRTEFPDEEVAELAQDIAVRGILQPIVVCRAVEAGRYRILFGAKRLRAAIRAGLEAVPVVIGSEAHDVYAQVAENQKRHGLTPLDVARFMRSRAEAGTTFGALRHQAVPAVAGKAVSSAVLSSWPRSAASAHA